MQNNVKGLLLGIWFYANRIVMILACVFVCFVISDGLKLIDLSKPYPVYSTVTVTECYIKLKDNTEPTQFCRYEGDSDLTEREYSYEAYEREKVFIGQEVERQTGVRSVLVGLCIQIFILFMTAGGILLISSELWKGPGKIKEKKRESMAEGHRD